MQESYQNWWIPVLAERISKEYGMVAQEITPEFMKQFGLEEGKGVVISKVKPGTSGQV